MTTKEIYIDFCKCNDVNLFLMPQWLDAAGLPWYVVQANVEDHAAFWVYHLENKLGFTFIRNPHLTPYTGIVFNKNNIPKEIQQQLFIKLIQQIPRVDVCQLDLPLYVDVELKTTQFILSTKKTNILELNNVATVYNQFKPALKRQIKKAKNQLVIYEEDNIELFYSLHIKTFLKQNKNPSIPLSAFKAQWQQCTSNQTGHLLFAKDAEENIHAALWLVYDHQTAYYMAGGTDALYYGSGAMSYLMWHAIEKSMHLKKKYFDFEGSMIPNINRFFSNFSPDEHHYLHLEKINSIIYKLLKST